MRVSKLIANLCTVIAVVLVVGSVCFAESHVQINVTSTPELGTTNRIRNVDFQLDPIGGTPSDWSFGTGRADLLKGKLSDETRWGEGSLYVEAASGEMSGYWSQSNIPVEPGEKLLLSAWVKLNQGTALMYAMGYDTSVSPVLQVYNDRRLYLHSTSGHPLYPVFVDADLLKGLVAPEWTRQRLYFDNSRDANLLRVSLGLFFGETPGEVWYERIYVGDPWVELGIEVTVPTISLGITRVQLLDDLGELVYDSGVLSQPVTSWVHQIQVAADVDHYMVVVTDAEGAQKQARFPHE